MKKVLLLAILLVCSIGNIFAQSGITFKVEELTKPKGLLPVKAYPTILEDLIRHDQRRISDEQVPRLEIQNSIVAKSDIPQALVSFRTHSFFEGVYVAYADHRPFTLSPDMVWIVISQGFAYHVNNNSEELRKLFVDFDGKTSLVIQNDKIKLNDPNSPWNEAFDSFNYQIEGHVGKALNSTLTADFSTTTATTRIASQITLMNALKSYFEFVMMISGCGIPEITLEGTPQDWQRLLTKIQALRKYKLDWWIDELEPVLKQFVKASEGKINKSFWRSMYKIHKATKCGEPSVVDGWIVKFYPYNKEGKRNNLKQIHLGFDTMPDEIVKVDVECIAMDAAGNAVKTPLEIWAGFVGLEQNDKTFGLKPTVGWVVRKKDSDSRFIAKLKENNERQYGAINLRVNTVPPELFNIGPIKTLILDFIDKITIPDELAKLPIGTLSLRGTITAVEKTRLTKLFPNTVLLVNGEQMD